MPWDKLILSPKRSLGVEATKVARVLGLECEEGKFLEVKQEKVRPEQVGREPLYLAGSAGYPCDLHEALRQGRRAASQTAEMARIKKESCTPPGWSVRLTLRFASAVDCVRKSVIAGASRRLRVWGGDPPHVDPMVCTGGAPVPPPVLTMP